MKKSIFSLLFVFTISLCFSQIREVPIDTLKIADYAEGKEFIMYTHPSDEHYLTFEYDSVHVDYKPGFDVYYSEAYVCVVNAWELKGFLLDMKAKISYEFPIYIGEILNFEDD